jgi:hypothetical protein
MATGLSYDLSEIARKFQIDGKFIDATPYGSGHINETYASTFQTSKGFQRFVHQRINHLVFKYPVQVMENVERVTRHIRQQVTAAGGDPERQCLTLIPTIQGKSFCQIDNGTYWRTYLLIENAETYDIPKHLGQVYATAKAYGEFQHQLASLPGERLHETITDFHNTPKRLQDFLQVVEADLCNRCNSAKEDINFLLKRSDVAKVVVDQMAKGLILERVTHNDTKINNVLIDNFTGEGICVIDLDTVMPGSALYDFGDMVRSGAATAAEDETNLDQVGIDLRLFDHLTQGYTEIGRQFLTSEEWDHLAFAGKLITYEQALRFLNDYLNGDKYYKIHYPDQNLVRARTQIKMVEEIEHNMEAMTAIIDRYR